MSLGDMQKEQAALNHPSVKSMQDFSSSMLQTKDAEIERLNKIIRRYEKFFRILKKLRIA
tara:strand:+ start:8220 stop:8399 length:180 start_codon:yes stop_codon:yes gene_type:complete